LQSTREETKEKERRIIQKELQKERQHQQSQSPLYPFMYALKSSKARRQYPKRFVVKVLNESSNAVKYLLTHCLSYYFTI
jgi:hypothetical protein